MQRLAFLAVICGAVAFGFGLAGASAAPVNGAAIASSAEQIDHVIKVADGCGRGCTGTAGDTAGPIDRPANC